MIYGSVCSGIEAATVAWHELGWKPAWFCEFDKFPSAVLKHRFPNTPNLGDMTQIETKDEYNERAIDLLVGGTPCQSFSIAGLRKGLDDERGNLALKFCQILREKQPRWFVWENVPGVFSSSGGGDFANILDGFRECGYGIAYRVFDSQYFGVPQRRRRVFVVGYLGDWRPATAVLFERESLFRDFTPSKKEGKDIAGYTASSFGAYSEGCGTLRAEGGDLGGGSETIICGTYNDAFRDIQINQSPTLRSGNNGGAVMPAICYENHATDSRIKEIDVSPTMTSRWGTGGNNIPYVQEVANCLETTCNDYSRADGFNMIVEQKQIAYSIQGNIIGRDDKNGGNGTGFAEEVSGTLTTNDIHAVQYKNQVRRLTPTECERLQGFPDGHTNIPWRGKDYAPDGLRYKALGNSMTVNVMAFIGKRIAMVEEILN